MLIYAILLCTSLFLCPWTEIFVEEKKGGSGPTMQMNPYLSKKAVICEHPNL